MTPIEVATLLNVSQAQIARVLSGGEQTMLVVSRYQLESWARDMRQAEAYLREWIRE